MAAEIHILHCLDSEATEFSCLATESLLRCIKYETRTDNSEHLVWIPIMIKTKRRPP